MPTGTTRVAKNAGARRATDRLGCFAGVPLTHEEDRPRARRHSLSGSGFHGGWTERRATRTLFAGQMTGAHDHPRRERERVRQRSEGSNVRAARPETLRRTHDAVAGAAGSGRALFPRVRRTWADSGQRASGERAQAWRTKERARARVGETRAAGRGGGALSAAGPRAMEALGHIVTWKAKL